jgi:hypothetical protein
VSKVLGRIGDTIYTVGDDGMVSRDGEVIGPVQEVLKFLGGYMEDVPEGKAPAAPAAQTAAPRPRRPDLPGIPGGDSVYLRLKGLWNDPGSGRFTPRGFSSAKAFAEQVVGGDLVRDAARVNGKVRARVADNRMSRAGIKAGDVIEVTFKDDNFGRVQIVGKNGKKRWYDVQWSRFDRVEGDGPAPEPEPEVVPEPEPVPEVAQVSNDPAAIRQAALDRLADVPDDPFAAPPPEPLSTVEPIDVFAVGKQLMGGRAFDEVALTEFVPEAGKNGDISPLFGYEDAEVLYGAVALALAGKGTDRYDWRRRLSQKSIPVGDRAAILHSAVVRSLAEDTRTGPDVGKAETALYQELRLEGGAGKPSKYAELLRAVVLAVEAQRPVEGVALFDDPDRPLDQNTDLFGEGANIPIMSVLTNGDLENAINDVLYGMELTPKTSRVEVADAVVERLGSWDIGQRMVDAGLDGGSTANREKSLRPLVGGRGVLTGGTELTPYGELIDRAMKAVKRDRTEGDPDTSLTDQDKVRLAAIIDAGTVVLDGMRRIEAERVPEEAVPSVSDAERVVDEKQAVFSAAYDEYVKNRQKVADAWSARMKNGVVLTLDPPKPAETVRQDVPILGHSLDIMGTGSDGHRYTFRPYRDAKGKTTGFVAEVEYMDGPQKGRITTAGGVTKDDGLDQSVLGVAGSAHDAMDELDAATDELERVRKLHLFDTNDDAHAIIQSYTDQRLVPNLAAVLAKPDEWDRTLPTDLPNDPAMLAQMLTGPWRTYQRDGRTILSQSTPFTVGEVKVGRAKRNLSYEVQVQIATDGDNVGNIEVTIYQTLSSKKDRTTNRVFRQVVPAAYATPESWTPMVNAVTFLVATGNANRWSETQISTKRSRVRREVAQDILEGGESVRLGRAPASGKVLATLAEVSKVIPRALLKSRPPVNLKTKGGRRSWYKPSISQMEMATTDPSTVLHELGHHLERNPELSRLNWAFYVDRTGGERTPLETMKSLFPSYNYEADEVTRPDEFFMAYSGKDYGRASRRSMPSQTGREMFTTGLEGVFFDSTGRQREDGDIRKIDDEHAAFILGSLLLLSRQREGAVEVDSATFIENVKAYLPSTSPVNELLDIPKERVYPRLTKDTFTEMFAGMANDPDVQQVVRDGWESRSVGGGVLEGYSLEGRDAAVMALWKQLVDRIEVQSGLARDGIERDFALTRVVGENADRYEPTPLRKLLSRTVDEMVQRGTSVPPGRVVRQKWNDWTKRDKNGVKQVLDVGTLDALAGEGVPKATSDALRGRDILGWAGRINTVFYDNPNLVDIVVDTTGPKENKLNAVGRALAKQIVADSKRINADAQITEKQALALVFGPNLVPDYALRPGNAVATPDPDNDNPPLVDFLSDVIDAMTFGMAAASAPTAGVV